MSTKSPAVNWQPMLWVALLLGMAALMLLPFWVMIAGAFGNTTQGVSLWPTQWTLDNIKTVFEKIPFWQYAFNSLWVAIVASVLQVLISAMAAFAFARMAFKYKNALFALVLSTLMVPPQVNLVPLFVLMAQLGLVNNLRALILPALFSAFGVFLLRQWFASLPQALQDAAAVDNCGPLRFFWHIALPLVRPALVALLLYSFIGNYNNLIWPLVVIHSEPLRTLPLGIAELKATYRDVLDWGVLLAACLLSVLPMLVLYLLGSTQLQGGLTQGGVKG